MVNKILIGIAVLGLTATVLAEDSSISETVTSVSTFNPGVYFGLQAGYGEVGWKKVKGSTNNFRVNDDASLTGRIFVGYDFTKYWAAEFGYTYFSAKTKIQSPSSGVALSDVRTQALDLVGKGKLPVQDNFDIYAKAGIGLMMSKGINKASNSGTTIGNADQQNNLAAVVGFGGEYYFNSNLWLDLSWTKNFVGKNFGQTTSSYYGPYQPNTDLYAVGIAYKFDF